MPDLSLYLKHRDMFIGLGCPTRIPDEWVSASDWSWFADIPYEDPIDVSASIVPLDVHAIGCAEDPMLHIVRAVGLPSGETLVVTVRDGPYVSSIDARVWPTAALANAAIEDELDNWAQGLGLQTFKLTDERAA